MDMRANILTMKKYRGLYGKLFNYELDYENKSLIRLEGMDYDTSVFKIPKIFRYAVNLMFKNNTLTYSDFSGFDRFHNLIKKYEDYRSGVGSKKPFIFVGSGVSNLVYPTIESVLDLEKNKKRKTIIIFEPEYPLLTSVAERLGANIVKVKASRENNYIVKFEDIETLIDDSVCAILFSYPNNPTCNFQEKSFFDNLVKVSKEKDIFIISDEIYRDTFYKKEDYVNIANINSGYDNFIRIYGTSKDMPGMTGMRCGYIIGDSIIEDIFLNNQLLRNFSGNIISEYLFMIDIALRYYDISNEIFEDFKYYPKIIIKKYFKTVKKNKARQKKYNEIVVKRLTDNKNVIDVIVPKSGNAVLFRYHKDMSPEDFQNHMIEKGLAVYPCDVFSLDENDGTWGRVCVTREISYLLKGIDRI